jgi:hypothetical protein
LVSFGSTLFKNKKCKSMDLQNKKHYPNLTKGKNGISNLPSKTLSMKIALI